MEIEAARAPTGRSRLGVTVKPITAILAAGLVIRLLVAAVPGVGADLDTFRGWSLQLADDGPWNFYSSDFFADYSPGYLYILWLFGLLNNVFSFSSDQFHYLLKLPAIVADLASAYLLYRMLVGQKPVVQLGTPILYLLLPTVLFIGPVWGQVDSILAFFLLLAVYYLAQGRPVWASVAYVVGFLIKPQAIAALPLLAFWLLRNNPARVWVKALSASIAAGLFIILPFFPRNPLRIFEQLSNAAELYPVNSSFAYNFWGMFGLFKPDDATFWGIEWRQWGIGLFAAAILAIIFVFRDAKNPGLVALATALSILAFYVFLTRMHERYLFPVFLPLLAACALTHSRILWASFFGLTVVQFLSLYYVYYYPIYNPDLEPSFLWVDVVSAMTEYHPSWWGFPSSPAVFLSSLFMVLTFPVILVTGHLLSSRVAAKPPPS